MRLIVLFLLTVLFGQLAVAQEADRVGGGTFTKLIEHNPYSGMTIWGGGGNMYSAWINNNKTRLEMPLLGAMSAHFEYLFSPADGDRRSAAGLCIVRNSSPETPYMLEVKWIKNWRKVIEILEEVYPLHVLTSEEISSMPKAEQERIAEHNKEMRRRIDEERFDYFEVETRTFPAGDLGGVLHDKVAAMIGNVEAEEGTAVDSGGNSGMFRCFVGDEVWTLGIQEMPDEGTVLQMSDLCHRIIEDVRAGTFDEQKYIGMLEPIEF